MKSTTSEMNSFSSSDKNICSPAYTPTISSKPQEKVSFLSPFAEQKIHLSQGVQSKSISSYKNQRVEVLLDLQCEPKEGSLSLRVFQQAGELMTDMSSTAVMYEVENDWTLEDISAYAEEDPCIIGVTWPQPVRLAALPPPALNDIQVSRQEEALTLTNFDHAYQYLIQKQRSSVTTQIALVDTGIDCQHTDLRSQLVSTSCGRNILNPIALPTDNDGHGTHVGGIISAQINNSEGIAGIAGPRGKLYAIKVLDVSAGTSTDAYNGIQHAIAQNVDVINVSLEAAIRLPDVETAIRNAVSAGIVVVMAAGNSGQRLGSDVVVSPAIIGAQIPGAITVGSIDAGTGALSTFSNHGQLVEIAAPGSVNSQRSDNPYGIYSTARNNSYQRMQGTSQAAPIIAGAAALVTQFLKENGASYSPADIENIIINSADVFPSVTIRNGHVLNFSKLVRNTYAFAGVPLCN